MRNSMDRAGSKVSGTGVATHLHIIYKGLVADTESLLAFDDCWISDGQNKLFASLWEMQKCLE